MPSEEKLQQQADNKRGHALARIEARSVKVDPATVDITERIIFTSEEEERSDRARGAAPRSGHRARPR